MTDFDEEDLSDLAPPEDGQELIIGLVGPAGAGLGDAQHCLKESLREKNYNTEAEPFRLSRKIEEVPELLGDVELTDEPADERIRALQRGGNKVRRELERKDALALMAALDIREYREEEGSRWEQVPRQAYILRSLKTPGEVETLRDIYGTGFVLVAVYAPKKERHERLAEEIASDRLDVDHYNVGEDESIDGLASELIRIDKNEPNKTYGQDVQHTFPKADFFLDNTNPPDLQEQVDRTIDLIFGTPYKTPRRDEQMMYMAEAARLRSSDTGRQVGAALGKPEGEVISVGCNDVPRGGGGLYWPGHEHDNRDFRVGKKISEEKRLQALGEVLEELDDRDALAQEGADELGLEDIDFSDYGLDELTGVMDELGDTRVGSLIEFYRTTHAEMEAILGAARKGIEIEGATLYSTTFPCHECTRHIVTSGIKRVVYIEPYPKSLGPELHGDSVDVEGEEPEREDWESEDAQGAPKVDFEPFVGVGPRVYPEVFTGENREGGRVIEAGITEDEPTPEFGLTQYGWWVDETLELSEFETSLEEALEG